MEVINLTCPGCGTPVSLSDKVCESCDRPIVITSTQSISGFKPIELNKYANAYKKALAEHPDNRELNTSIAICYWQLGLYDKAIEAFEKALVENFDYPDTYFYAALCMMKGKKPFVTPRDTINKMMEYLDAAIMIEDKAIYHYLLAYIKLDYFNRKSLNISPSYQEELDNAMGLGLREEDTLEMKNLCKQELPESLL